MSDQRITVAIVYSGNWRDHVAVEVLALHETNPDCKIYLLSDEDGRLDIPGCVFIDIVPLGEQRITNRKFVSSRFTIWAWYRLLLPEVIPEARVLYIDADAIVNGSLQEFWDTGLQGGALVAGVRDVGITKGQLKEIGLKPGAPFINAGVTLLDLDGIRSAGLYEKWLEEINTKNYSTGDQHVINGTCRGRINLVDSRWNSSLSTGFADEPVIAHYAGTAQDKGWSQDCKLPIKPIWDKWAVRYAEADQQPQPELRIPKVIHTAWYGPKEMPDVAKRCMETWHQHMPDWQIKVWNESNMAPSHNRYALAAYKAGKFAHVWDWLRLRVLYWEGGVTLDTDVQVLKSLEPFLQHRAFTSHEADKWLLSATLGAELQHPWIKMLLDHYERKVFDGGKEPNTQLVTRLSQPWIERQENGFTYLRDGVVVYPTEYLAPFDHHKMVAMPTENTHAAHLFLGSWLGRSTVGRELVPT